MIKYKVIGVLVILITGMVWGIYMAIEDKQSRREHAKSEIGENDWAELSKKEKAKKTKEFVWR